MCNADRLLVEDEILGLIVPEHERQLQSPLILIQPLLDINEVATKMEAGGLCKSGQGRCGIVGGQGGWRSRAGDVGGQKGIVKEWFAHASAAR